MVAVLLGRCKQRAKRARREVAPPTEAQWEAAAQKSVARMNATASDAGQVSALVHDWGKWLRSSKLRPAPALDRGCDHALEINECSDEVSAMTDNAPAKRKPGRPTKYSPARAKLICDAIASGQTAREFAATQEIPWQSVCNWRDQHPEFAAQLKAAQAARAEHMAAEILEISDDSSADWIEYETPTGRIRREPNHELVQRARLRVETRKYLMEKWSPHNYGPMQRLELTGAGGGPILLEQLTLITMQRLAADRAAAASNGPKMIDDAEHAPRLTYHKTK
jgi:hypothetical protein